MNAVLPSKIIHLNRDTHERMADCQGCSKRSQCPMAGRPDSAMQGAQPMQKMIKSGKAAFEAGDKFEGVYIVRSGFFKSYSIDADGATQVTGFHLPGEFFGMDGIEDGHHREYVEALDTSSVCRIPMDAFSAPATTRHDGDRSDWSNNLMFAMVKLMSRTIGRDHEMFFTLGKLSARRKLGTFLADLSRRMARGGYSSSQFRLCMSRTDIANHLGLALETVSRVFTQLHVEGALEVSGREIRITDEQSLLRDDRPNGATARRMCAR